MARDLNQVQKLKNYFEEHYVEDKKVRGSYWLLIGPAISLLMVVPYIASTPPFDLRIKLTPFILATISPFYLGLIALPGYFYFWLSECSISNFKKRQIVWIGASLWCALIASILGLMSFMAIITVLPVLGSITSSIFMLKYFYYELRLSKSKLIKRTECI